MVTVHEYLEDTDQYRSLAPVEDETTEALLSLGAAPATDWQAPRFQWTGEERVSDFPFLIGHVPVVSDRALDVLKPFLGPLVDTLPIRVPGGGYTALHIRDLADCLDTDASKIRWFEPGHARSIERYVFDPDALRGHGLFRLQIFPDGYAFLTGEVMAAIKSAGLTGLMDAVVWEG
jgi:hypothetical protein